MKKPQISHPCSPAALEAAGVYLYGPDWQSALGRALHASFQTVHNWKIGKRKIPGPAVAAIRMMVETHAPHRQPSVPIDPSPVNIFD